MPWEPKEFIPYEDAEHGALIRYLKLQYPKAKFHHSPLEGKRTKAAQAKLKRDGASAGFFDIVIYDWLPPLRILHMEVKRLKGSTTSEAQKDWQSFVLSVGGTAVNVKGFEAGKKEIDIFFSRPK